MTVAQSRKGRRPMRVETMLKKEEDGSLFKKIGAIQAPNVNDSLLDEGPHTGRPALQKRKKGDVPTRDEDEVQPKTEQTQTNRSTTALSPALDQM